MIEATTERRLEFFQPKMLDLIQDAAKADYFVSQESNWVLMVKMHEAVKGIYGGQKWHEGIRVYLTDTGGLNSAHRITRGSYRKNNFDTYGEIRGILGLEDN